jgi:hypothetical protein
MERAYRIYMYNIVRKLPGPWRPGSRRADYDIDEIEMGKIKMYTNIKTACAAATHSPEKGTRCARVARTSCVDRVKSKNIKLVSHT